MRLTKVFLMLTLALMLLIALAAGMLDEAVISSVSD
jgi:hypothetical protein